MWRIGTPAMASREAKVCVPVEIFYAPVLEDFPEPLGRIGRLEHVGRVNARRNQAKGFPQDRVHRDFAGLAALTPLQADDADAKIHVLPLEPPVRDLRRAVLIAAAHAGVERNEDFRFAVRPAGADRGHELRLFIRLQVAHADVVFVPARYLAHWVRRPLAILDGLAKDPRQ
jgi:hypothetical protein